MYIVQIWYKNGYLKNARRFKNKLKAYAYIEEMKFKGNLVTVSKQMELDIEKEMDK